MELIKKMSFQIYVRKSSTNFLSAVVSMDNLNSVAWIAEFVKILKCRIDKDNNLSFFNNKNIKTYKSVNGWKLFFG